MDSAWGFVSSNNTVYQDAPPKKEDTVAVSEEDDEDDAAASGECFITKDYCLQALAVDDIVVLRRGHAIGIAIIIEMTWHKIRLIQLEYNDKKNTWVRYGSRRWIPSEDVVKITLPAGSTIVC